MVNGAHTNVCIICGKQRVVVSTTEEIIGTSKVVSQEMSCPDPVCQKKLDKRLDGERLKREGYKQASLAKTNAFGAQRNRSQNS